MRVSQEDGVTRYEANGRTSLVTRKPGGYTVHAMWTRDGKNWIGGHGEGTPVSLDEATDLAKRFVSGQSVPEELGGYEDNKPKEVADAN